jgi:hypothetical protein
LVFVTESIVGTDLGWTVNETMIESN